jgi:hypothetical protein
MLCIISVSDSHYFIFIQCADHWYSHNALCPLENPSRINEYSIYCYWRKKISQLRKLIIKRVTSDCSFCWYLWNWWLSLFKLSFHNSMWLKTNITSEFSGHLWVPRNTLKNASLGCIVSHWLISRLDKSISIEATPLQIIATLLRLNFIWNIFIPFHKVVLNETYFTIMFVDNPSRDHQHFKLIQQWRWQN